LDVYYKATSQNRSMARVLRSTAHLGAGGELPEKDIESHN